MGERTGGIKQGLARTFSPNPGPGNPWPLFWFSLKNILFSRKKTPLLLAFLLLPMVLTLFIAGELDSYETIEEDSTDADGGRAWFEDMMSLAFFPLLIPIVVAVYATGTIGEEVEGKTLPYLFTRPIFRSWTLMAKSLSFLVASIVLAIVALTITFFVSLSISHNPFGHLDELFGYWGAIGLIVFGQSGVFLLLGVSMRFAMVLIVVYTFLWETVLGNLLPASVLKYSFVWYERAYINSFIGRRPGTVESVLVDAPSPEHAALVFLVLGVVGFVGALVVVSFRDYNV